MFVHRLDKSLNSMLVCLPFERVLFFIFSVPFVNLYRESPLSVKC